MTARSRKEQRTREILDATRELFDTRGMRDAQIGDIADAVGINRAIIYRHFTTKEELFAMVVIDYLDELGVKLTEARDAEASATSEAYQLADAFFEYGIKYPAFVDCAQSLLRLRGGDIVKEIAIDRLILLGEAMNRCIDHQVEVYEKGNASGEFRINDPVLLANVIYTQSLGFLNLVSFQKSVSELNPGGEPVMLDLPTQKAKRLAIDAVVAVVRMSEKPHLD